MTFRRLVIFHCVHWSIVLMGLLPLNAQTVKPSRQKSEFREAVALDVDSTIDRRFETVRQHLAAEQWDDALRFLGDIRDQFGSQLLKIDVGRYVSVDRHCNDLLRQLPAAGLAIYRQQADPRAARWFESARQSQNINQMRRVLTEAPQSRYEREGLSLLAEWEWQRGRPAVARHYWQRLVDRTNTMGEVLPQAELLARIQLCDLALGRMPTLEQRQQLKMQLATTKASLTGVEGTLSEIIADQNRDGRWQRTKVASEHVSFAGASSRTSVAAKVDSIRTVQWQKSFTPDRLGRIQDDRLHPSFGLQVQPNVFPITRNGLVFFNDPRNVYAIRIEDGEPAWSTNGVILRTSAIALRYPISGSTAYSMSIDDSGRLLARMGSPVTVPSERELTALRSEIVCLDIAHSEGRELWRVDDAKLNDPKLGKTTVFDGAPVSDDDRVYSVVSQSGSRTELFVFCFDADTGTQLWRQRVCTVLRQVSANSNEVSHSLLSVSDDHLIFSTNQGAVAALNKETGVLEWVVTYDSSADVPSTANPAIIHANHAYVAPSDSKRVLAIDLWSGEVVWSQTLPDKIRHLLGVASGRLFASGRSLWSLDAMTGRLVWGTPAYDPEHFGFGRGILAGTEIYWPKRRAIEVRSQETGRMVRPTVDLAMMGIRGGNLLTIRGSLLISGSGSLSLIGATRTTPVMFEKWWH